MKKALKYDDVYHSYLIVKLQNGREYIFERNHVLNLKPASSQDFDTPDIKSIPLNDKVVNMKSLLENAEKKSPENFHRYIPSTNNCQKFVDDIVKDNNLDKGITDPKTKEIIEPQDGKALVDSLGSLKEAPQVLTDFAHRLDTLVRGEGIKKHGLSVNDFFSIINHEK